MRDKQIRQFSAILAIGTLVLFAYLYGNICYKILMKKGIEESEAEAYVYFATTLAGLVGGVVASLFSVKLPENPGTPAEGGSNPLAPTKKFGFREGLTALGHSFVPGPKPDALMIVSALYVIVYFVIAIAAIFIFLTVDKPPDLIKNLALISFGLILAIVRTFFEVPEKPGS